MPGVVLRIRVTQEDIAAARAIGATTPQIIEFAIHKCFDEAGVPRHGRNVEVTKEFITIKLPDGWWPEDPDG